MISLSTVARLSEFNQRLANGQRSASLLRRHTGKDRFVVKIYRCGSRPAGCHDTPQRSVFLLHALPFGQQKPLLSLGQQAAAPVKIPRRPRVHLPYTAVPYPSLFCPLAPDTRRETCAAYLRTSGCGTKRRRKFSTRLPVTTETAPPDPPLVLLLDLTQRNLLHFGQPNRHAPLVQPADYIPQTGTAPRHSLRQPRSPPCPLRPGVRTPPNAGQCNPASMQGPRLAPPATGKEYPPARHGCLHCEYHPAR